MFDFNAIARPAALSVLTLFPAVNAATPAEAAGTVEHRQIRVNGVQVDQYSWPDSKGLQRTVSLKREGGGNPGHGGYAVQMTYEVPEGGGTRRITADAGDENDGGFGYFVSHEFYRKFTDNKEDTIAHKVFHTDDSPLGKNFPVTGRSKIGPQAQSAAHQFKLDYFRYGTIAPIPWDDGEPVSKTPVDPAAFQRYVLKVTMTWTFEAGTDFPRVDTEVDMSDVGQADRVAFDVRAPYGVLKFDNNADKVVKKVMWGDRFHFQSTDSPATRASDFVWDRPNKGARYTALIAGAYEMGIYEPKLFKASDTVDGWSDARGNTSATYDCGELAGQVLPCDWEWPYQSLQYSLPYDDVNAPTTGKKIAWGSAPYYGAGPSLPRSYDTGSTYQDLVGFPASKKLRYSTCIVLGKTIPGGLTKAAAAKNSSYSCAAARL